MNIKIPTNYRSRFITKQKQDIGVSPHEIKYRGIKKAESVYLRVVDYNSDEIEEKVLEHVAEIIPYHQRKTVSWFNIDGLHDDAIMEQMAQIFELDHLVLAEVLNTQSRARLVEFENCLLISLKMLMYDEESDSINVENLSLVMMDDILISFQERRGDVFDPVRERLNKKKRRIRTRGADYLTFALLDIVIDNYLYILSILGEKIEILEENLLTTQNEFIISEINNYKKELNFLRRTIKPAKEMIFALSKLESELIEDETDVHLKELLDNISQASDTSDSYREILSDQLNIYHTTITSKLNDIMKFLTVFSVVFIPLTFIAGIYGTNFDFLPELHYKYSYFIMWIVILVVASGMLLYFKRKKWL